MGLKDVIGDFGLVYKINVSNLAASLDWYGNKLGLEHDAAYDGPTWVQFNVPGVSNLVIGLNVDPVNIGSGSAVPTFVVKDIEAARSGLVAQGIEVGDVQDVGSGVKLAFMKDPDGNTLGLRQNPA